MSWDHRQNLHMHVARSSKDVHVAEYIEYIHHC